MVPSPMSEEDPSLACAKPFLDCRPFYNYLAFTSLLLDFFGPRKFCCVLFNLLKTYSLGVEVNPALQGSCAP